MTLQRLLASRAAAVAVIALASTAAAVALGWWLASDPAQELSLSLPGMDGRPDAPARQAVRVSFGEQFASFAGRPSAIEASWPRFRGAAFDNVSAGGPRLLDRFPAGGPPVLWSLELGEGHAGAAVANGRVYVLDYDERLPGDSLRCFSLDDGREIWRLGYRFRLKRNHGRSRTVPAVTDSTVVTIGPACHVMAADARTGELRWGIDLVSEYGIEVPLWYTGQCPLVDGETAVIAVGGATALMIGVDLATGKRLWSTPNPGGLQMSHSSIVPMAIHGRRTYVYAAIGGIVGVEPGTGRLLWMTRDFDATVIAPSPVHLGGGRIHAAAGYGAGSILIEVRESGGRFEVETLGRNRPNEGFASEQQTPILLDGHLFGIMPKDGGALRNQFVCWNPERGIVWSSGETRRYGLGPYMLADGKFLILSDEGELTLARATTAGFQPLATARVLTGGDSWGPLALADGRLIARDSRRMVCLDLRAEAGGSR